MNSTRCPASALAFLALCLTGPIFCSICFFVRRPTQYIVLNFKSSEAQLFKIASTAFLLVMITFSCGAFISEALILLGVVFIKSTLSTLIDFGKRSSCPGLNVLEEKTFVSFCLRTVLLIKLFPPPRYDKFQAFFYKLCVLAQWRTSFSFYFFCAIFA